METDKWLLDQSQRAGRAEVTGLNDNILCISQQTESLMMTEKTDMMDTLHTGSMLKQHKDSINMYNFLIEYQFKKN